MSAMYGEKKLKLNECLQTIATYLAIREQAPDSGQQTTCLSLCGRGGIGTGVSLPIVNRHVSLRRHPRLHLLPHPNCRSLTSQISHFLSAGPAAATIATLLACKENIIQ